jgi:hypothetical protein
MDRPLLYSLGICAISVALEKLFAGGGIKQRVAELRVPRFVPPLWERTGSADHALVKPEPDIVHPTGRGWRTVRADGGQDI